MNSKSKMVSFRLSAEEYSRLREAASAAGVVSLSELARSAMQKVLENRDYPTLSVVEQVRDLRTKINALSDELDRLTHLVVKSNGVGV